MRATVGGYVLERMIRDKQEGKSGLQWDDIKEILDDEAPRLGRTESRGVWGYPQERIVGDLCAGIQTLALMIL